MMETYLSYILKSSLILTVVYLLYQLLRNDKNFLRNRLFLIVGIMLAFIIPLISFTSTPKSVIVLPNAVLLDPVILTAGDIHTIKLQNIDIFWILICIYLSGIIFLMIRDCFQVFKLIRLAKRAGISSKQGYKVVLTKEAASPFSFFNLIFINDQINGNDAETILTHEQVHIRQRHSIDVILMEIVVILQWFNPFVWFYRTSVREVHEYLADRTTLHRGIEKAGYFQLLFAMALNVKPADVTNNFCQTKLKRRLTIITKNHHAGFSAFKFALILPALALFVWLVSCNDSSKDSNELVKNNLVAPTDVPAPPPPPPPPAPDSKNTTLNNDQNDNDKVYTVVEEMPSYPGGNEAMNKFLVSNFVYPTIAKEKGTQGTVYVSFVVAGDGSISNVKVLRGIGDGCDEEAIRIVKSMPKWIPGKQSGKNICVEYNLPIKFKLQ